MRFSKFEGIGNDFVMIADPEDSLRLDADVVRRICDRRFGVGGDGVIRVAPAAGEADLFMDYINSDGSIAEMCGNGIRCLAVFAREEGLWGGNEIRVGTRAGLKLVTILEDAVRVDMGPPVFLPGGIPVRWKGEDALHAKVELDAGVVEAACVSMGNPHAVLFLDDPSEADVASIGRAIETHPMFPNGTNVEFVHVVGAGRIDMRVWERGSGETLACGTGACAAAVAARLLADTAPRVTVLLPGGEVEVEWNGSLAEEAAVFMTGPARRVFRGELDLDHYARGEGG